MRYFAQEGPKVRLELCGRVLGSDRLEPPRRCACCRPCVRRACVRSERTTTTLPPPPGPYTNGPALASAPAPAQSASNWKTNRSSGRRSGAVTTSRQRWIWPCRARPDPRPGRGVRCVRARYARAWARPRTLYKPGCRRAMTSRRYRQTSGWRHMYVVVPYLATRSKAAVHARRPPIGTPRAG